MLPTGNQRATRERDIYLALSISGLVVKITRGSADESVREINVVHCSGVYLVPAYPRLTHRCTRELVETRKCEIESALAMEMARRERSEARREELERSTASLSQELEVMFVRCFHGVRASRHTNANFSTCGR